MAGHPTEINTPTPRAVSNIESSFSLIDQMKKWFQTINKVFILLYSNFSPKNLKM